MGNSTKKNKEHKKTKESIVLNVDQIISLMSIYLNEYEHRNDLLWRQVFQFYYATLIVIVLPNITDFLQINVPEIPSQIFYIIGSIMSILFWYVAVGTALRTRASYIAYEKVANLLEDEKHTYSRVLLKDNDVIKYRKIFNPLLAFLIISVMFVSLLVIAFGLLYFSLINVC